MSTSKSPLNRDRNQSFNKSKSKSYRLPLISTTPRQALFSREQHFVLDCIAVSNISNEYSTVNPKLGSAIPPYDSQLDPHTRSYFQLSGKPKTLGWPRQSTNYQSLDDRVHDRFYRSGDGFQYLSLRNKFGSGHSFEEVHGHELFRSNPTPGIKKKRIL